MYKKDIIRILFLIMCVNFIFIFFVSRVYADAYYAEVYVYYKDTGGVDRSVMVDIQAPSGTSNENAADNAYKSGIDSFKLEVNQSNVSEIKEVQVTIHNTTKGEDKKYKYDKNGNRSEDSGW